MKNRWALKLAILILAAFSTSATWAQVDTEAGVARISMIHGDVSTQRGDSGDWAAAALNAPIVSGDKISTGDESRAEVQLDYSNILRLGNRSQANITNLGRTQIQVQIANGMANYTVFKKGESEPEIDTPNVAIHPIHEDGSYRITVFSNDETELVVRKGEADVSTPQGSTRVKSGQSVTIRGTGDNTQYKVADAPGKDDWDKWNSSRDNTIRDAEAWKHTDRYYVGSEDLDSYGHWTSAPDYGSIWVPSVPVGWAPYRAGRWVWEPFYGWTWVSYEPWGWAPYHYGRWFLYGSSWAWWPGPVYAYPAYRPIWAPAYVSFFGFGLGGGFNVNFGLGYGFGSVGWLPIGPCDRFYPWWGGYRNHFNVVNITNINVYRGGTGFRGWEPLRRGRGFSNLQMLNNERVRNAVSTVPAGRFGEGHVAPTAATGEMFRNGHVLTGNLPVVPSRESLSASGRSAVASSLPRGQQPNHFFSTRGAAPAPQPFDRQVAQVQHAIERDGHFAPVQSGSRTMAMNTKPAMTNAPATRTSGELAKGPSANEGTRGGFSAGRATNSVAGNSERTASGSKTSAELNNGWTRFGSQNPGNSAQHSTPGAETKTHAQTTNSNSSEGRGWQRFAGRNQSDGTRSVNQDNTSNGRRPANSSFGNAERSTNGGSQGGWQRFNRSGSPSQGSTSVRDRGASVNQSNERGWGGNQAERNPRGPSSSGINRSGAERGWGANSSAGERSRDTSNSNAGRGWGGNQSPDRYSRGTSSASEQRGWSRSSEGSSSRPPLDMRQPIVGPRSSSSQGGGYRGGNVGRDSSGGGSNHGSSNGGGSHASGGGEGRHR